MQRKRSRRSIPVVRELALKAAKADVHFTIDAEEADRLELQIDVFEALLADDELFANGWGGFGIAIQAYQKRAAPLCDWVVEAARAHGRKLMCRLVKGAYWDTEIKAAQVGGLTDYPVFTRKVATDVSYLACAKKLLAASDVIYPAFATHNANTIGQVKALAGKREFEFQRLHGMGEELYEELAKLERHLGDKPTPVRIYAPVGSHKELLAYLVRRLLENGANSSFVNRIADEQVSIDELVRDPVAELEALEPKRNPKIILPRDVFGAAATTAPAVDLSDPLVREPLLERLKALEGRSWTAKPTHRQGRRQGDHVARTIAGSTVGTRSKRPPSEVDRMVRAAPCRAGRLGLRSAAKRGPDCSSARPIFTRSMRRNSARFASAKPGRPCSTRSSRCARRSISSASTRPKRDASSPGRFRFRGRPASRTSCGCTAAECSRASRPGISRWQSSPGRLLRRSLLATRLSPSRPSRRR